MIEYPLEADEEELEQLGLGGFDPVELQEAMALSLETETKHQPGEPGASRAHARSLHEAGIPATPASARARRKRRS